MHTEKNYLNKGANIDVGIKTIRLFYGTPISINFFLVQVMSWDYMIESEKCVLRYAAPHAAAAATRGWPVDGQSIRFD